MSTDYRLAAWVIVRTRSDSQGSVSLLRRPLVWLVVLVLAAFAGASHADEFVEEEEEDYNLTDRWVPSVVFSITVHQEDATLDADNSINFAFKRNESPTLASLRFGGEMMTPTFASLPLEPRFFASLGVLWSTPGNGLSHSNHDTASVDDYRDINLARAVRGFDRQEAVTPGTAKEVEDFEGRGTRMQGRQLHNAWYFGVGSVFTFPRSGFTFRVRPSLEYVGEEFRTEGEYTLLTDVDPTRPRFEIHEIALSDKEVHHNLGPGLELEFVNHLDGNLTLSFFTQTRFLWIVGDRKTTLKGDDDRGTAAEFSFKRNRFNFRGGAGIRLGFKNLSFTGGN